MKLTEFLVPLIKEDVASLSPEEIKREIEQANLAAQEQRSILNRLNDPKHDLFRHPRRAEFINVTKQKLEAINKRRSRLEQDLIRANAQFGRARRENELAQLDQEKATYERGDGYWTLTRNGNAKIWTPVFGDPTGVADALFPFEVVPNVTNAEGEGMKFHAFHLLPSGRGTKDIVGNERVLWKSLINSYKQLEGTQDIISPVNMGMLMNVGARILMNKTKLHRVPKENIILTVPPSSSPTAEQFGTVIKNLLDIPEENCFFEHFQKRTGFDVINDVKHTTRLSDKVKERVLDELINAHHDRMDAPVQIKKLSFRGDRDKLLKAGIPFLKTRREINIQHLQKVDPYFVVVDDRMSSGNTAATVRKVFQQATGVEIPNDHVYMLSLFDTTKRS